MAAKYKSIALALATALAAAPIMVKQVTAQQIGTTTAVNPSSEATPPGGSTTTLTVGARVLHKERIHTSPTGSVQLLFLDKSTLSIAPNTSLVIDEFVFDPASGSGHMLTKLTQGTLQYVGGQLSHQGAVTIGTPAATIGIRGGIGIVSVGPNGTQTSNLNGQQTIQNGAGTINHRLYCEHCQLEHAAGAAISDPARAGSPPHHHFVEHKRPEWRRAGGERPAHDRS